MIPPNIDTQHIMQAIAEIDQRGVPAHVQRESTHLEYHDRLYPPRYLVSLANFYANGWELQLRGASDAAEALRLLDDKGFHASHSEKAPHHAGGEPISQKAVQSDVPAQRKGSASPAARKRQPAPTAAAASPAVPTSGAESQRAPVPEIRPPCPGTSSGPPRRFLLVRYQDEREAPAARLVAEGVQFSCGKCALAWLTRYESIGIHDHIEAVRAVHCQDGRTYVSWLDDSLGTGVPGGSGDGPSSSASRAQ